MTGAREQDCLCTQKESGPVIRAFRGGGGFGSSHVHAYTFDIIVVVEANLSDRDFTDIAAPFVMKSLLRCTVIYVNGSYDLIQIGLIGQDLQYLG